MIETVMIADICVDVDRFQFRHSGFIPAHVERIAAGWDWDLYEPIKLWKNCKLWMLSGHNRLEAARRRGLVELPADIFRGTEAEARRIALAGNLSRADYTHCEYSDIVSMFVEDGKGLVEISKECGKSHQYIKLVENLKYTSPFIREMVQSNTLDYQYAAWCGYGARQFGLEAEQQLEFITVLVSNCEKPVSYRCFEKYIKKYAPKAEQGCLFLEVAMRSETAEKREIEKKLADVQKSLPAVSENRLSKLGISISTGIRKAIKELTQRELELTTQLTAIIERG